MGRKGSIDLKGGGVREIECLNRETMLSATSFAVQFAGLYSKVTCSTTLGCNRI